MSVSMMGLRDWFVMTDERRGSSAGKELPLMKSCPALRTWRYDSLEVKSAQRGMLTLQSHCLYCVAQSVQLTANENMESAVVLHWVC